MTKIVRHALAIIILLCLPAAGCGPGQAGLSVKVHLPPAGKLPAGLRGEQPPGKGEFPAGITDFRLCVSAADMAKPRCDQFNKADYLSQGKARLGGIPAGSNRKVTFQGYDFKETSDEKVVWCGEVSGVEINKDATTQVEMFVTACSNFTLTRGDLERARAFHTATRLPDGRVLVTGGFNVALGGQFCPDGDCLRLSATDSIEIYDPRQGTFSSPPGAALSVPRALHTATLLPDGRVLVAGGAVAYLVLMLSAPLLADVFSREGDVHDPLALFLRLGLMGFPAASLVLIANATFNAHRQPLRATSLNLLRLFGVLAPLAWLGSRFMGLPGIFLAMSATEFVVGAVAWAWLAPLRQEGS